MKKAEQNKLRWTLLTAGLAMVLAVTATGCARTVAVETGYGPGYVRPGVVVRGPGYVRPGVVVRRPGVVVARQPVYVNRPAVVVRQPVVVRRPAVVVRRPAVGVRVVGPRGGSITIR